MGAQSSFQFHHHMDFSMGGRERSRSPARGEGAKHPGIALRWNERGFGFIKPDDGGEDLFCHHSSIEDGQCLTEGSRVFFVKEYDASRGRERAINVSGGSMAPNEARSSQPIFDTAGKECGI